MNLKKFFSKNPNCAIAFSGGVDSSYLLYEAIRYGKKIKAYLIKTPFQPQFEIEDAIQTAKLLGADLQIVEYDILKNKKVCRNHSDRCYDCKKTLFSTIIKIAEKDGFDIILDGTNASDDASDRPGMKALAELNVYSPLRECGLSKKQIRRLSKKAGLLTYNKPAYACLATRITTGTSITKELLSVIEKSETFMMTLGFSDFRIRTMDQNAKIQLKKGQFQLFFKNKEAIFNELSNCFQNVLLDLNPR